MNRSDLVLILIFMSTLVTITYIIVADLKCFNKPAAVSKEPVRVYYQIINKAEQTNPVTTTSTEKPIELNKTATDEICRCVPDYNLMLEYLQKNKPRDIHYDRNITALAAYQFQNYSVITIKTEGLYGSKVYCRYYDSDGEIGIAQESYVIPDYAVYCCRRPGTKFMTLTKTDTEEGKDWLPMIDRLNEKPEHFLGMCLGVMYDNETKWLLLAELMEHYKLQGVTHFYIYIKDSDDYLNRLLYDYEKTGGVTLIWLGYESDRPGKWWQIVGIQDCLVRSRMHSEYSIIADLDERIKPTNTTLVQFVKDIVSSNNKIANIQFIPRWILREHLPPTFYEGEKTMKNELPTLVFHNTSMWPPNPSHTSKCIINPAKIYSMWIHYPHIFLRGYTTYFVPPETGIIWHYRELQADNWGTTWLLQVEEFGNFTNTSYPEPLLSEVYKQVKIRLDKVYPSENQTLIT